MRIRVAKLEKVERLGWRLVAPHPDGGWVVEKRVDGCVLLDTIASLEHDPVRKSGTCARLKEDA